MPEYTITVITCYFCGRSVKGGHCKMDLRREQSNVVIIPLVLILLVMISLVMILCYIYKKTNTTQNLDLNNKADLENLRNKAVEIQIWRCNVN